MNRMAMATAYLIDDDSITLELMSGIVEPIGVEPVCFSSAEAFLESYSPRPCECVITDMRMPGVSGLQLHKVLQQRYSVPPPNYCDWICRGECRGRGDETGCLRFC